MPTTEQQEQQEPLLPRVTQHGGKSVRNLLAFLFASTFAAFLTESANVDLQYIYICRSIGVEQDKCFTSHDASEIESSISGISATINAIVTLLVLPTIAYLSNVYDRKPVLLACAFFTTIRQLLFWYLAYWVNSSYLWLIVPALFESLGTPANYQVLSVSYICDIIKDTNHRGRYFSWSTGSVALSGVLGPLVGSALIEYSGTYKLYVVTLAIELLVLLFGWFSLDMHSNKEADQPERSFWEGLNVLKCEHIENPEKKKLARKIVALLCTTSVIAGAMVLVIRVDVKYRFGWSARENGILQSVLAGMSLVAYTVIYPLVYSKLGDYYTVSNDNYDKVDRFLLVGILVIETVGYAMIGFAKTSQQYTTARVFETLSVFAAPAIITMLCKFAPPGEAGNMVASLSVVVGAISLGFPFLWLHIYRAAIAISPVLIFYLTSAVFAIILAFTLTFKVDT